MSLPRSLRFGWLAEQRVPAPDLLAAAGHVEQLGFDSVWLSDHLADERGVWLLDPWTTLAALLASMPRITAGTLVASNSLRAPLLTAQMARTLSELAPGRFVLGLGAGGSRTEHLQVGVEYPAFDHRIDELRRACQLIRRAVSRDSPWESYPQPVSTARPPVPLVLGGLSPAILELAATYGDGWAVWGSPADLRRHGALLSSFARTAGRLPQDVLRSAIVMLLPDHLPQREGPAAWPAELRGDADAVGEQLDRYRAAGVGEVIVCDYGVAPPARRMALEWFAAQMKPFQGRTREASTK